MRIKKKNKLQNSIDKKCRSCKSVSSSHKSIRLLKKEHGKIKSRRGVKPAKLIEIPE